MSDQTSQRFRKPEAEIMPPAIARALLGLLIAALALVAWARLTDRPPLAAPPDSPVSIERQLIINANLDGDVSVQDLTGNVIAELDQTTGGGFISTINVVIERKRLQSRVEGNPPVTLIQRENGRISVVDPSTGWEADLMAFGADNVGAFAKLLLIQTRGNQ